MYIHIIAACQVPSLKSEWSWAPQCGHSWIRCLKLRSAFWARQQKQGRLGFFLRWIDASTLVASGLGVLGITWIAAKERTREFGTRRALGATAVDIFLQVILESIVLALAGCVAGATLSSPISRSISQGFRSSLCFQQKSCPCRLRSGGSAEYGVCSLAFAKDCDLRSNRGVAI